MTSFRFVHAADLHLDTPFAGVAQPAPHVAAALRDASLAAWDALVELTLAEHAAFLLLAGDIYDGADRGVRAQLRFLKGLRRLSDAGVRVFIVHGNHDPIDRRSAVVDYPANAKLFPAGEVESVPVTIDGEQIAIVHGISYDRSDTKENLALHFHRAPGDGLQVGLLHANVGANAEHGAYAPCTLGDLEAADLDYWALGHVHKRAVLRENDPWVVYPGDTQGRSPKPSERGEKGALVVDVSGSKVTNVRFAALDVARFVACGIDIADATDLSQVQARLIETLARLRDEHAGRHLLVRATLEGRGPVAPELHRQGAIADMLVETRNELATSRPFLWVESIVDRSRSIVDLDTLRERPDLSGELVRLADGVRGDSTALAAFIAERSRLLDQGAVGTALRRLAQEEDADLFADEAGDILDDALALALDRLEQAGGQ
jgi:DNA repair protein SbcD/Mre11